MKNEGKLGLFLACALLSCSLASGATASATSWKLKTDDTVLTVGVSPDNKLCLYELSTPGADWNWFASPSVFPLMNQVEVNGATRSLNWVYRDATVDKKNGTTVTIRFTNTEPAMELKSVWQARPGQGPVRHTMFIQNNTMVMVTLHEQESMAVRVGGPAESTLTYINDGGSVPDKTGVYREALTGLKKTLQTTTGYDWIPFIDVNANSQVGMYFGWEWSYGRINIAAESSPNIAFIEVGNGNDFKTDIYANEIFEVPPAFIGSYKGDLDCGGNSLRKYLFNYSMPAILKKDAGYPKLEWNAFAAAGKSFGSWDPVESKYYPLVDDIAPLGFEEVVIDVGWWSAHGAPGCTVSDPVDWPSGMNAAAKYAQDKGLRFGLYDNQVEKLTKMNGIKNRIAEIAHLINGLGADFYRSDGTEGGVITGGSGPDHRSHYPQDGGYWATKGYYEVIDKLYADIPNFTWENCNGGGAMKDYGTMKRCSKIQAQDEYFPIEARQAFYDTSHAMHPMQIAALTGSWGGCQAAGSVYEFRCSSMGASYWHPDAPNGGNGGPVWSAQQKADIKKAVTTYKEKLRPLIRNANLYHIFPRPNDVDWDGVQYYNPKTLEGVVYIFKPKDKDDSQVIKLKGLDPKRKYKLTFEDGSNPEVVLSGATLMDHGVSVTLKGKTVSELMFISKK